MDNYFDDATIFSESLVNIVKDFDNFLSTDEKDPIAFPNKKICKKCGIELNGYLCEDAIMCKRYEVLKKAKANFLLKQDKEIDDNLF